MARELMAPDSVGYLEGGQEIVGPEAFIAFQASFLEAMPDLHIEIVDSVADRENACIHWVASGTHTGAGLGITPVGLAVSFRGVTWLHTKDGKITGGRDFWNMDALMRTLANAADP